MRSGYAVASCSPVAASARPGSERQMRLAGYTADNAAAAALSAEVSRDT